MRAPTGLKVIRKVGDRMEKENYPLPDETLPKQRFSGIFGYHMTTASDRSVVLMTNERDALAVYEATDGALAFALPQGEKVDSTVFPYLEDFEQIFLWFPPRHIDFAKEWGYALNGSRCYLIKNNERPIELVRNNKSKDIKIILNREAVRLRDKGFRSMTDIRDEVKADLINSSTRQMGLAQWKRFSPLNKYLIGLRPGELTVLTGGTGFGKTTFLCEYALDLFTQGVRTLFCSFEMPEEKILKWMLIQYAGLPLYRVEYSSSIDTWLDKFERTKGPLTIMKSDEFREKSINQIASVDRFVGHMRALATQHSVHVTMVVHPRKTDVKYLFFITYVDIRKISLVYISFRQISLVRDGLGHTTLWWLCSSYSRSRQRTCVTKATRRTRSWKIQKISIYFKKPLWRPQSGIGPTGDGLPTCYLFAHTHRSFIKDLDLNKTRNNP
uniref:SF4 helicase domain-containing protein n=1 Tax=Heterorhabditis bacteriophora TaxID=37862 RepID=A0A1I7X602_HETBA